MSLWDRLSDGVRTALDRPAGAAQGPLSDRLNLRSISDDVLRAELERRRRARGRPANGRPAADDELTAMAQARRDRMRERSVARCYALLELPVGSSRAEVQRAFRTMLRQYHPDRYVGDVEQHASAVALVTSLVEAYLALLAHHDRRG
ncbi:MAG: J domain-containing protein [Deltaproteobacteria bacterium]|jgi:DnaJ-domain-containing protein 1|nr:J domain-containing protein [Deltaproteobacteria bacterium]MBK8692955.1 J domain-containing protein [Deltaproteobacteria bacterium]MBP6832322.1 J domain-containing protein [Deltaproteobacteria bacterium]